MKNNFKDTYRLLSDAYDGTGGFFDGSYLTKHPRESDEKFRMRGNMCFFLNYFKPCVDAHVDPIFNKPAVRDWSGPAANAWEMFTNDVNFDESTLEDLMEEAAHSAKINGVSFVVMDRVEDVSFTTIGQLQADRRNIPYAFVVDAIRVDEIDVDKFGRITKFVYKEADPKNEHTQATRTMTLDGWTLVDSDGEHSGQWALGMVPVIPVYSKQHKADCPLPPSEFLSIAKTNLAIFNESSLLTSILVDQTFSILTYPSTDEEDLVIGTSNALGYPAESSHTPAFIAPSSDPANILASDITRLQEEAYRMAGVVNVTGVRVTQSGTAKAWDFEQTNKILSRFANKLQQAEMKLANLFSRWVGADFEYNVAYPKDFKIAEVESELANAEIVKGLAFGEEFNVEMFKRVLTAYLPELSDDRFDELVKAYEEKQAQDVLDIRQSFGRDEESDSDQESKPDQEDNIEDDGKPLQ